MSAVERAAEVVNAHIGDPARGGTAAGAWVTCKCGLRIGGVSRDHATGRHRKHAAQALADAGLLSTEVSTRVINEAIGWDDRKVLARVFQEEGGRFVTLDDDTHAGLLAVARWGAQQALTYAAHERGDR